MKTVAILSWKEFSRAFGRRAPGGRDFFWLAVLLCLLQGLALIMVSAREGVLERSVDAFLGYQPGYGIPVWTRPNAVGHGGVRLISEGLIDQINGDGFAAEPFRRLFGPELVAMPAPGAWISPGGQGDGETFVGLVADFDGPLFPAIHAPPPPTTFGALADPLWPVVLDTDQFRRHFDLQAYRAALSGRIPAAALDEIPSDLRDLDRMPMIWMNVRTLQGPRLTPFRVTWARYLGVGSDDYAYMIDRRFHMALMAQNENPALCIDATSGPGFAPPVTGVQSVQTLVLPADQRALLADRFRAALQPAAAQFGGLVEDTTLRMVWQPGGGSGRSPCPASVPVPTLALYLAGSGLALAPEAGAAGPALLEWQGARDVPGFAVDGAGYSAPCDSLSPGLLANRTTRTADTDGGCVARVSATPEGRGYGEMLVFVRERTAINRLQDYINCTGVQAGALAPAEATEAEALCVPARTPQGDTVVQGRLMLSEVYQDSLRRLAFLTRLFDTISGPIGLALVLLLVAILQVQISTVVGHRRHDYALLLASGFSPRQLTVMVTLQVMLGVVLSMAVALALFLLLKVGLVWLSRPLALEFERIMLGRPVDVLPIAAVDAVRIVALVLVLSAVFVWLQMRRSSVTYRRSLEDLLK